MSRPQAIVASPGMAQKNCGGATILRLGATYGSQRFHRDVGRIHLPLTELVLRFSAGLKIHPDLQLGKRRVS
jgi:hypothetical protein